MLPLRWSLSQKGIEPFYSVIRLHQTVKIELLDGGDLGFHARRKVAARRLDGVTQPAGALRLKVFVEIHARSGLGTASVPVTLRPDKSRSIPRCGPITSGNKQDAAGANTPSFISGWPSEASGAVKIRCPASATSRPPPRHWPRTATSTGTGDSTRRSTSTWILRSISTHLPGACSSTLAPKLKCGPSASSNTAERLALPRCSVIALSSAAIISASTIFAFGRLKRRRRSRPSTSNQTLSGDVVISGPSAGFY